MMKYDDFCLVATFPNGHSSIPFHHSIPVKYSMIYNRCAGNGVCSLIKNSITLQVIAMVMADVRE